MVKQLKQLFTDVEVIIGEYIYNTTKEYWLFKYEICQMKI
jgi:hypothetical protein